MATKNKNRPCVTRSAVVRIRVPCRADGNLVTDAEERLSRGTGVTDVTVDEIRGLNPGLSATIITISVRLRLTRTGVELREQLADVSGLESIEKIE